MSVIFGADVLVSVGGTVVGSQTGCEISMDEATADSTVKSSTRWETYLPEYRTWTVTADHLLVADDTGQAALETAARERNSVSVIIAANISDAAWQGTGYVTSLSMEAPIKGITSMSVEIQGTGLWRTYLTNYAEIVSGDELTLPTGTLFDSSTTFTVEMWAYWGTRTALAFAGALYIGGTQISPTTISIYGAVTGRVEFRDNNGLIANVDSGVDDDEWHHYAVTVDPDAGANSTGQLKFYVDGALAGSSDNGAGETFGFAGDDITIGDSPVTSRIAMVRLWSDVRTLSEISDNKDTALLDSPTGLIAQWLTTENLARAVDGEGFDYTIPDGVDGTTYDATSAYDAAQPAFGTAAIPPSEEN